VIIIVSQVIVKNCFEFAYVICE